MHSVAILDRKMLDIPNVENAPAEMEVGRKNFLVPSPSSKPSKPLATGPQRTSKACRLKVLRKT
jgi:hypothetical protein